MTRAPEGLAERLARESGRATLVIGEAGSGKTTVLRQVASSTKAPRVQVAAASAPLAGVHGVIDVLSQLAAQHERLPPEDRRILDRLATGEDCRPDDIAGGLRHALRLMAHGRNPVLLLVDDLDQLDPTSAATLRSLAALVEGEPIAMVATSRRLREEWSGDVVPLRPLSPEAAERLLCAGGASPAVARSLSAQLAGNPAAIEAVLSACSEAQLRGSVPLPSPLPIGRHLQLAYAPAVASLPEQTRVSLAAVALDPTAIDAVPRAVVEPAIGEGLAIDGDGGVHLRDGICASAIWTGASPCERREAHRLLADRADARGRPAQALLHRARATGGTDDEVCDALEREADHSIERYDLASAVELWASVPLVTMDEQRMARALHKAATACYLLGWNERALSLIREFRSIATASLPPGQLERLEALVGVHLRGVPVILQSLDVTAAALAQDAPAEALSLLLIAGVFSLYACRTDDLARFADDASTLVLASPLDGMARSLFDASAALYHRADPAPMRELAPALLLLPVARPARREPLPDLGLDLDRVIFFAGMMLLADEQWAPAEELFAGVVDEDARGGWDGLLGLGVAWRAELLWRTGRWSAAIALARASHVDPLVEGGRSRIWLHAFLAHAEAAIGEVDVAAAHLDSVTSSAATTGIDLASVLAHAGVGRVALGDDNDASVSHLERARELAARGPNHPGIVWWHADLAEALLRAGRTDDADEVLREIAPHAEAAGCEVVDALLLRSRGMLLRGRRGVQAIRRSIAVLEKSAVPFELARSQLALAEFGAAHVEDHERRVAAAAALAEFDRLGARSWIHRARRTLELHVDAGDVRSILTDRELEVAQCVADGATNQEAAAALHISTKTVEFHLGSIFRKLGVARRSQLGALMNSSSTEA